jgi:hypothetical protein
MDMVYIFYVEQKAKPCTGYSSLQNLFCGGDDVYSYLKTQLELAYNFVWSTYRVHLHVYGRLLWSS